MKAIIHNATVIIRLEKRPYQGLISLGPAFLIQLLGGAEMAVHFGWFGNEGLDLGFCGALVGNQGPSGLAMSEQGTQKPQIRIFISPPPPPSRPRGVT